MSRSMSLAPFVSSTPVNEGWVQSASLAELRQVVAAAFLQLCLAHAIVDIVRVVGEEIRGNKTLKTNF